MKRELESNGAPAGQATEQEMWLLGQAPLRKYLDFIEDVGGGSGASNRVPLVREWSAAAAWYEELKQREAGIADHLDCTPLGPEMAPLAEEVMRSTHYACTFDKLPTAIAMVELAHLVVCQNHVTHSFVDRLKQRLERLVDTRYRFAKAAITLSGEERSGSPQAQFAKARRELLITQRAAMIEENRAGRLDDEILRKMLRELDLEELSVSTTLTNRLS